MISAFTATATKEVKNDIAAMLRLRDPFTITTGFDRKISISAFLTLVTNIVRPCDLWRKTRTAAE